MNLFFPSGIAKRDIQTDWDFSEELMQRRVDFEKHWYEAAQN